MDFGIILLAEEEERRASQQSLVLHRRSIRDTNNPLEISEERFTTLFRISKEIAMSIIEGIKDDVQRTRCNGLPVHIIVLTAVRFYAVGSYQRCIGQEYNLALGQKTVSKLLGEVSRAIVLRLFPTYVRFPGTVAERNTVADGFFQKHGIPDCLGCVDGTHVAIVTPYNNDPNDPPIGYKNRKGNYTINVQLICDANLRLLNVNARFPGSTHDQHIFNNSNVKTEMMRLVNERIGKYYLIGDMPMYFLIIGDSGYAKESYMLTPILPPPEENTPEMRYNRKIIQTRNCIERTNGVLKAIFRCLRKDRVLHYQPEKAALIVTSCCTIYNMMHHYRFSLPEDDFQSSESHVQEDFHGETSAGSPMPRAAALRRQQEFIQYINN